jgi:energy-coupling factor transporter ATP-binding protein EcfA2
VTDLNACLRALEAVAEAAEALGLGPRPARETAERARRRLGFPGTTFVLALAGGTGSGKSSLLNALAGTQVSPVGAVRPVTAEPVAWVPADQADELRPLLEWIGVERVVTHRDRRFDDLCLIDLPDYDSVERAHRARVDEVLPKVDAVCWVLDPQKYNDRVLHEDYLRPLAHHAKRALFAVNRRDTLGPEAAVREVVADVRRTLAADGIAGRPVFAVAAAPQDGQGRGELERLRDWLAERMEAKAIVVGRLAADCLAAGEALAAQAGLTGEGAGRPLADAAAQAAARGRAVAAARSAVDIAGVRIACLRRVRAEARATGAGPFGRLLGWLASRRRGGAVDPGRSVDPVAYARGWRQRATRARTVNPVRELVRQAAAAAPAPLRASLMQRVSASRLEARLGAAVDDAVARATAEDARVPRSWLWPLTGVLQALTLGAILLGVSWLGVLWLAGQARADLPRLPTLWGVPMPLVLIGGGVVAGLVLGRVLEASAVVVGQRWARRLARRLDRGVAAEIDRELGRPLAEVEAARSELLARLGDLRVAAAGR